MCRSSALLANIMLEENVVFVGGKSKINLLNLSNHPTSTKRHRQSVLVNSFAGGNMKS